MDQVRPNRSSRPIGGRTASERPGSSRVRRHVPRSARVARSTRNSNTVAPSGLIVARRMTSLEVARTVTHPSRTSTAMSRDDVPSSEPARTTVPNGPAANDSAGNERVRRPEPSARPVTRRWPARAPAPSSTGSSRNHGTRSGGGWTPPRIARAETSVRPMASGQSGGTHGRVRAPSVVDARTATAPSATIPGPALRSHVDLTITWTSPGGWCGGRARRGWSQAVLIADLCGD